METSVKTQAQIFRNETTILFVIGLFVGGLTLLMVSLGDYVVSSYEEGLHAVATTEIQKNI
jgi:hypothetical protein